MSYKSITTSRNRSPSFSRWNTTFPQIFSQAEQPSSDKISCCGNSSTKRAITSSQSHSSSFMTTLVVTVVVTLLILVGMAVVVEMSEVIADQEVMYDSQSPKYRCYGKMLSHLSTRWLDVAAATTTTIHFFPTTLSPFTYASASYNTAVVNHTTYVVTFMRVPAPVDVLLITWETARQMCRDQGEGWGLAAPQNSLDGTGIYSILAGGQDGGWLGGYTAYVPKGFWIWADGRFRGVEFTLRPPGGTRNNLGQYNDWVNSNEPSYYQCADNLTMPPEYQLALNQWGWNDFVEGNCTGVYDFNTNAICEKSSCTLEEDCIIANTNNISSGQYAPNCVCTCKNGFAGDKCSYIKASVVVSESEYITKCEESGGTPVTWEAAQGHCQSMGVEWNLASVPDDATNTLLTSTLMPLDSFWIGAQFGPDENSTVVSWQFGRLAGEAISTTLGPFPTKVMYAPYTTNNPGRTLCIDVKERYIRVLAGTSQWEDIAAGGCFGRRITQTFCYACERQICVLNKDCAVATTMKLVGTYFPQCECLCIPKFRGKRCDITSTVSATIATTTPTKVSTPTSTLTSTPTRTWTGITPSNTPLTTTLTFATNTNTNSHLTLTRTRSLTTSQLTSTYSKNQTATLSYSASQTITPSQSITQFTPSYQTHSASPTLSRTASRCEYTGGKTPVPACGALGRGDLWGNGTDAEVNVSCDPSEVDNGNVTTVYVPYGVWGSGDVFQTRFPIAHMLGLAIIPNARGGGEGVNARGDTAVRFELADSARLTDTTHAHLTVNISYTGYNTLAGVSTRMWLPVDAFIRCPILIAGGGVLGQGVPVDLELLPADVSEVPGIGDVAVGIGVIGSVASGSPTALVRASMLSSLEGMLRCSEFDAEDEVSFLNNPASWAVGPAELQYQRGSLLIGLILLAFTVISMSLIAVLLRVIGKDVTTWGAAITAVRIPSVVLVAIAFVAEMSAGSASSTLFLSRVGDAVASDYVLALVCVLPVWAYVGLYGYQVTWGMRVDVVPASAPGVPHHLISTSDDSDNNDYQSLDNDGTGATARRGQRSRWRAALVYALEPTHVPCVRGHGLADQDGQAAAIVDADLGAEERWLRRNYYFVADRRWAAYGAIEVAVGSLVDVIDGIPMTTRNPIACIGRPASMVLLLTGLMVALVWKKPYSVRLQLWTAFAVVGLMLVSSVIITANSVLVNKTLDSVAGGLMSAAGIIICIFSAIDTLLVVLTLVPALRRLLGLRQTSLLMALRSLRGRSAALRETIPQLRGVLIPITNNDDAGVAAPRVALVDNDNNNNILNNSISSEEDEELIEVDVESDKDDDDELEIQRMILEDIENFELEHQYNNNNTQRGGLLR